MVIEEGAYAPLTWTSNLYVSTGDANDPGKNEHRVVSWEISTLNRYSYNLAIYSYF